MTEGPPEMSRRAVVTRRLIVVAVVFTAWAVVGLIVGWSAEEWAVVGFLLVVSSLLSALAPPGRRVAGPIIFLSILALGAAAAIFEGDQPDAPAPTATAPTSTSFDETQRRVLVERAVRDWFAAYREGDAAAMCLVETEEFSQARGGCVQVEPQPGVPAAASLEIESIEETPEGAVARVSGGDIRATVHLRGGTIYLVDRVEGLFMR